MTSPLEKFQYLTGLTELSWDDCQDAWFEAKRLIPEVADELAAARALAAKYHNVLEEIVKVRPAGARCVEIAQETLK